jgi:alpha,alpha-trehalase
MRHNWMFPARDLGELFEAAQTARVFVDSKTLADAVPLASAEAILGRYRAQRHAPGFDLASFVREHFLIRHYEPPACADPVDICAHIDALWPALARTDEPDTLPSSRIPLPFPYVVPGGRFDEIYYWDSYFTMLGLMASGQRTLAQSMVRNFLWLVDTLGYIPNGSRTYYLSRSQPPFLAMMVEAALSADLLEPSAEILEALCREHDYWSGHSLPTPGPEPAPIRYTDALDSPRDEAWVEDQELVQACGRADICLHIRSACASGWDFSSRWLADKSTMCSIRAASIAPVDLQCLVWKLEDTIAQLAQQLRRPELSDVFRDRASARHKSIVTLFFNEANGFFDDLDANFYPVGNRSLAGAFPLFFGLASDAQANQCAAAMERVLLRSGGLMTTDIHSGQQWDAPNGWAPLQYIAAHGLLRYGHIALATDIMRRWNTTVAHTYQQTGKIMEKYNVIDPHVPGGGGEYPNQDGFGWTNAVYLLFHHHLQHHGQ